RATRALWSRAQPARTHGASARRGEGDGLHRRAPDRGNHAPAVAVSPVLGDTRGDRRSASPPRRAHGGDPRAGRLRGRGDRGVRRPRRRQGRTAVRGGETGPTRRMLVQYVDDGRPGTGLVDAGLMTRLDIPQGLDADEAIVSIAMGDYPARPEEG